MVKRPIVNTVGSGYLSTTTINNNFTAVRNKFDNTLSLDGSTPNAMEADLDMNGNDILNTGSLNVGALTINGITVAPDSVTGYETDVKYFFKTLAALKADTKTYTYFASNDVVVADGYIYDVAASGASDHHYTTAGGVKLYVRRRADGSVTPAQFGWLIGGTPAEQTAAIQAAIDFQSEYNTGEDRGGSVVFGPYVYTVTNLELKSRVKLVGSGIGSTILRGGSGVTGTMLFIGDNCDMFGWNDITFDGNNGVANYSYIIEFEEQTGATGGAFQPWEEDKTDNTVGKTKYKHCIAHSFQVGNSTNDGIYLRTSSYQVYFDNFTVSYCLGHGMLVECSDSLFSNFYCEMNFEAGVYASGSNNKYVNGKAIWSGRGTNTFANWYVTGSAHMFVNCEGQDGFTHGWNIGGSGHKFRNVSSNSNGKKSFVDSDESSRLHSNYYFRATADEIDFEGRSYDYATAVGPDGFWFIEKPYEFETFSAGQFTRFIIDYDNKYNTEPSLMASGIRSNAFNVWSQQGFLNIDVADQDATDAIAVRLFRDSSATATTSYFDVMEPGTANVGHRLGSGGATLSALNQGDVIIGDSSTGGAWNTAHLRLGPYHIWVDGTGDLRIKSSAPTSGTDGTVIGTQT